MLNTGTWSTDGGIRWLGRLRLAGQSQISGVALLSSFLPSITLDTYLDQGVVLDSCGQADIKLFQRDLSRGGFCGRSEIEADVCPTKWQEMRKPKTSLWSPWLQDWAVMLSIIRGGRISFVHLWIPLNSSKACGLRDSKTTLLSLTGRNLYPPSASLSLPSAIFRVIDPTSMLK